MLLPMFHPGTNESKDRRNRIEQVQQLPGMDPILVVKHPRCFRKCPHGLYLPHDVPRSTWILVHGRWEQVEDRATPLEQHDGFDRWVEGRVFNITSDHLPRRYRLIRMVYPPRGSSLILSLVWSPRVPQPRLLIWE